MARVERESAKDWEWAIKIAEAALAPPPPVPEDLDPMQIGPLVQASPKPDTMIDMPTSVSQRGMAPANQSFRGDPGVG
jgi:hypothetical protein